MFRRPVAGLADQVKWRASHSALSSARMHWSPHSETDQPRARRHRLEPGQRTFRLARGAAWLAPPVEDKVKRRPFLTTVFGHHLSGCDDGSIQPGRRFRRRVGMGNTRSAGCTRCSCTASGIPAEIDLEVWRPRRSRPPRAPGATDSASTSPPWRADGRARTVPRR